MKKILEKFLSILVFACFKVLPLLLLLGFVIAIYFNLVYVQMATHFIALGICTPLLIGSVYGYGKYLGMW